MLSQKINDSLRQKGTNSCGLWWLQDCLWLW
jgi:hypothetical protein